MILAIRRMAVVVFLAAGLSGCAAHLGECEPGVSELSRVDPTPPPGC